MKLIELAVQSEMEPIEVRGEPFRTYLAPPEQTVTVKARFAVPEREMPPIDLSPGGLDDPSGMSSWVGSLFTGSKHPAPPIGSSSASSKPHRAVLTVRAALEGAPTFSERVQPGDTATTVIACQVISPGGEMHWVHIPLEFTVTVIE